MSLELGPSAIETVPESNPWNVLEIIWQNNPWSILDIVPKNKLGINLQEQVGARSWNQSWDWSWDQSQECSSEHKYAISGLYFDPWIAPGSWRSGNDPIDKTNRFLSHLAFNTTPTHSTQGSGRTAEIAVNYIHTLTHIPLSPHPTHGTQRSGNIHKQSDLWLDQLTSVSQSNTHCNHICYMLETPQNVYWGCNEAEYPCMQDFNELLVPFPSACMATVAVCMAHQAVTS